MKKSIQSNIFAVFLTVLFFTNAVSAQQYFPVVAKFTQLPPYPVYLADFSNPNQTNLSVQIQINDQDLTSRPIKLKFYIKGQGFQIESADLVQGEPAINLTLGQIYNIPNAQVANYFNQYNLKVSAEQYRKPFSEGTFNFGVQVLDFATNRELSGIQWSNPVWITQNDPPVWVIPADNSAQTPQNPQNINFQWAARHKNVSDVDYEFSITELFIGENFNGNIQNLFLSQPPTFKVRTKATSLNYNITLPPLMPGRTYAYRVQAIAKRGFEDVGVFRNNGYSEIRHFQYGERLKPPTNLKLNWNDDAKSLTFNWKGETNHKTYEIQYREKGSTEEWKKLSVTPKNGLLNTEKIENLEAVKTYEFKIDALGEQNQRASATPLSIAGISQEEYLKKSDPDIQIEGKVEWAFYRHGAERTNNTPTERNGFYAPQYTDRDKGRDSFQKPFNRAFDEGSINKYELQDAIVSLYSSEKSDITFQNFKQNENSLKLIETVNTDKSGKYTFKNKKLKLLKDLKNLYVYVKYKNEAFDHELKKITIDENKSKEVQKVDPILVGANSIRYGPKILANIRYKRENGRSSPDFGSNTTTRFNQISLYRLKSVIDKNPYLVHEGMYNGLINQTKRKINYNGDDYVEVLSFINNESSSDESWGCLFGNKHYNDKFIMVIGTFGRKNIIYPVNSIEDFETQKVLNVTDYFKYTKPKPTLSGYVLAPDKANPLKNGTVHAFGQSYRTDAKGFYEIELPDTVRFNTKFNVSVVDPLDALNKITEELVYKSEELTHNFVITGKAITITGRVISASDDPVQGARVVYNGKDQITNSEGIFTFIDAGEDLKGSIKVSLDGYTDTTLNASNFVKKTLLSGANESQWIDAISETQTFNKAKQYAGYSSKLSEYVNENRTESYKKNHTDLKRVSVAIFDNAAITLNSVFKVKIITQTIENKLNALGMRNMKGSDSSIVKVVEGYLNVQDKETDIPITGYKLNIYNKTLTVKVANKKDAKEMFLEEEVTFKLPAKITKLDSTYTFKVTLKPADYFYGVVMDSTVFIKGVHSDTAKNKPVERGKKLRAIAGATVKVEDVEATTDENGNFKVLVPKGKELSFKIEGKGFTPGNSTVSDKLTEKFSKTDNRKDFYLFGLNPLLPEFKTLLGFDVTIDAIRNNAADSYVISGSLHLTKGKAGDNTTVNMLYQADKSNPNLTFKDIVVTKEKLHVTNAMPVQSFINFVEIEAKMLMFGYAPVLIEGNPAGEPYIRLQKIVGGKVDVPTGGKIGATTLQFTKTEILSVDFGKMELEEKKPEKEKAFGKFDDKVSDTKKKEVKDQAAAAKTTKEAKEAAVTAEDKAKQDRIETASAAKKEAIAKAAETKKSGTEDDKKTATKAVADAKKEEKDAKNAMPTDVPEKEPLMLVLATVYLEDLSDAKEFEIVFKTTANKAGRNADKNITNANTKVAAAKDDTEKAKAESKLKDANFQKSKVGANEDYIKFPIGTFSAGVNPFSLNIDKTSGVLKKSGITMKGVMGFPELAFFKRDKPILVEKLEIDKKFDLKQVILGNGTEGSKSIAEFSVGNSWMFTIDNFQIFNNFKGYGIGGRILNDKENYLIVKSLAFVFSDSKYPKPNIELDFPEAGMKIKKLRFKTIGKKSISFKYNIADKAYELDGSLKIEYDESGRVNSSTDSTTRFGKAITDSTLIKSIAQNKAFEAESKEVDEKRKLKTKDYDDTMKEFEEKRKKAIEDKKTDEEKKKEKADADKTKADDEKKADKAAVAKTNGVTLFPIEVHRFTWSTTGKFLVAAKVGKISYGGLGINIRRIIFTKAGMKADGTPDAVKKDDLLALIKPTEEEMAKLNSSTKFNDKQVSYKTDSLTGTKMTGALSEEEQAKRAGVSSANVTVKEVADKVAKANPNAGWAFGIAGGIVFDGSPKGLSFDSDITLLVGDYGKGTEYDLGEAMFKVDIPGGRALIKVKIATSGEKVGAEGSGEIETAGMKLGASLKFYKYTATNDIEFGVGFMASTLIPVGNITFTSLGGGIDLDTKLQKFQIYITGSAINTGTPKKVTEYKAIKVAVLFDGIKCGVRPVIKGSMELWTIDELFCSVNAEIDICNYRLMAKVNCTKEIIAGTKAELNALFIASTSGGFLGATVRAEMMGAIVNGRFALGVVCDTKSDAMKEDVKDYIIGLPTYLYQQDGRTFSGIYISYDMSKEFKAGNSMSVFGVDLARYELEGFIRGKAKAGVNFSNGNFNVGIDARFNIEGYMEVLKMRLNGKVDLALIAEGGRTNELGWNYKAIVGANIDLTAGAHEGKDCNSFCIACVKMRKNSWGIPYPGRDDMFLKACVNGRFGIQYQEKGYGSGYRSISE
jgi:hypothetical protein